MEAFAAMTGGEAPLRLVMIGAGNVASHLLPALCDAGKVTPLAIWSRHLDNARRLAAKTGCDTATDDLAALPADADIYLVSTTDDGLAEVASKMTRNGAVWAHTSGSVDASALAPLTDSYGVFYPLQTFSRDVDVDMSEVPFFIEGSNGPTADMLRSLARAVSPKVYDADSELRARMHVAAVFACNFCNHLWALADDMLRRDAGLDLTVLHPLLRETLRKAMTVAPAEVQTGPARRGDTGVMQRHIDLLPGHESDLYKTLSESIMNYYDERNKL